MSAPPARERTHLRVTLALTVLALALRVVVALALHPAPAWDGELYERAARQLAEGHGYTYAMFHPVVSASDAARPTAYYPVGYPAFLALVYAFFGASLRVMHLAGAFVSALAVPLAHRVALRIGSPRAALCAALALALMPGQLVFAAAAMTEPLYGLLLTAAVLALVRRRDAPHVRDVALFGALLGLATLVRPQALLLAPVLPLLRTGPARLGKGLRARVFAGAVATTCCLAAVAPWTARNCRALDRCALVSTNGGSNLAIGAVHRSDGGYLPVGAGDGCVGVSGEVSRDRCWRQVAIVAIRAKPARWVSLAVTKLDLTLSYEGFPTGYLVEARAIPNDPERVRTARRFLTGAWRLLLMACAFGLLPLRRRPPPPRPRGSPSPRASCNSPRTRSSSAATGTTCRGCPCCARSPPARLGSSAGTSPRVDAECPPRGAEKFVPSEATLRVPPRRAAEAPSPCEFARTGREFPRASHDDKHPSMASFEIILGEAAYAAARDTTGDEAPPAADLLDVVVDGERVGAAGEPVQAAYLLRELVSGALTLLEGRGAKAHVSLTEPAWELCLVSDGPALLVSLYRTGPLPEVKLLDRAVSPSEIAEQSRSALEGLRPSLAPHFAAELGMLLDRLDAAAAGSACVAMRRSPDVRVVHEPHDDERAPLRLQFEALVGRQSTAATAEPRASVRADLHALLVRGRIALDARGRRVDFGAGFVFLQLERLLSLCHPLLEAHAARRALHLRVAAGHTMLAVRLSADGRMSLNAAHPELSAFTTPALDVRDFVLPVTDAALALAQAMMQADPSCRRNIRLRALRSEARNVRRQLRLADRVTSKVNADPSRYRTSAVSASPAVSESHGGLDLGGATRLRYAERWRAEIEGIDLAGTLLCGDRVVVTGVRETLAIDRRTGAVLWSRTLPRAATAIAGGSILRLTARGEVELRDVSDGETVWASRIAPRVGAAGHAFTVTATGLPRVVLLAEGERRLVALDLATGEPRWRYQARNGGTFKLRRHGRLVFVASGDAAVTALDVATGEVVWRCIGPAPFTLTPSVHGETVLALAGSAGRGSARLCAIDAYTGELKWTAEHSASAVSLPAGAAESAAIVLADREGTRLVAHDIANGREQFCVPLSRGPAGARSVSLNAFDELLVTNAANGRVTAVDAAEGEQRWSRLVAAPIADDAPRRMDVQLRAGALFVPQSQVAVLRPRDGAPVASIESCDLVPDLLRVDEQCALYVAEESGHLGCYELAARLSLVH